MGSGAGDRWRWLGRPFFWGSVGLLAINDHLLKAHHPGWLTGKLSDFAGIVVVATLAAVLIGRRPGLVLSALAFAAVKVLPGAASLVVPLLGGLTRLDATDLIALSALVPLDAWLRRLELRSPASPNRARPSPTRQPVRAVTAALLPLLAAFAAIVTATATACPSAAKVVEIDVRGSTLYALVVTGGGTPEWAASVDGGESWLSSQPPTGRSPRPSDRDAYYGGAPNGPAQSCASDGTCFRVRDARLIERRAAGGSWQIDRRLSDSERNGAMTACAGGDRGILGSIGVVGSGAQLRAVASVGANGVLARTASGTWVVRPVRSARPITHSGITSRYWLWGAGAMVLIGLALGLYGRRRWPSLRSGLLVLTGGTAASLPAAGVLEMMFDADGRQIGTPVPAAVAIALMWAITVAIAAVVSRRPSRNSAFGHLPPPPAPPGAVEQSQEGGLRSRG